MAGGSFACSVNNLSMTLHVTSDWQCKQVMQTRRTLSGSSERRTSERQRRTASIGQCARCASRRSRRAHHSGVLGPWHVFLASGSRLAQAGRLDCPPSMRHIILAGYSCHQTLCSDWRAMLTGTAHSSLQGLRAMQKRMHAALADAGAARTQNGAARPSRGSWASISGPAGRRQSAASGPAISAATPLAGDKELFASLVPLIQVPNFVT